MKHIAHLFALLALVCAIGSPTQPAMAAPLARSLYLPIINRPEQCAPNGATPGQFTLVAIDGAPYKDNRLTDNNADLRLQTLGFSQVQAALNTIEYYGPKDGNAIRYRRMFNPPRTPAFTNAFKRHDWAWQEQAPAPHGTRGGTNNDWAASVLELATSPKEPLTIPHHDGAIWEDGSVAMVLYADERNITITYGRQDSVARNYVVYMSNLCVDDGLVSAYRSQTAGGKRSTGWLPAIKNGQRVGWGYNNRVVVAVRDVARFMDPRATDWWQP